MTPEEYTRKIFAWIAENGYFENNMPPLPCPFVVSVLDLGQEIGRLLGVDQVTIATWYNEEADKK